MQAVRVNDPNSDKFFTVEVSADIKHLDTESLVELREAVANLAKLYARHLGYIKVSEVDESGIVLEE